MDWQTMRTALKDGAIIEVRTAGGSTLLVFWAGGLVSDNDEEAFGWHAAIEDIHPDCWDDGVCWASNAAGKPSDPPVKWRETQAKTRDHHGAAG